jgi:hypothetical protein
VFVTEPLIGTKGFNDLLKTGLLVHLIHSITCLTVTQLLYPLQQRSVCSWLSVHHLGSETTPDKPKKPAVVGLIEIVTTFVS